MTALDKLEILGPAAEFDTCNDCCSNPSLQVRDPWRYIYQAALPSGSAIALFKVLMTNVCTNDCAYCANQVGRDVPRTTFQPEELAHLFLSLYQKHMVQGLFLSSAVGISPPQTMEAMLKTVEILRYTHKFHGYIHLKILPGATIQYINAACRLANRVSVNIEAPTAAHLALLSSQKDITRSILTPMHTVKEIITHNENLVPAGQTTQFVVGAADETDFAILHTTANLYQDIGLKRVYFSAFRPIANSRLEHVPPTPPLREHRLYQADWLLRVYNFTSQELALALNKEGNLSLTYDPKTVIAQRQPWLFPVDIEHASYAELLRVPGIGTISAKRIVRARQEHSIVSLKQLGTMGVTVKQAVHFIRFKSMLSSERQLALPLWELEDSAPVPV